MSLFDTPGADSAYDKRLDPPERVTCPKFPDHDCEDCHSQHVEAKYFNAFCPPCQDEKCPDCDGDGWRLPHKLSCAVFKGKGDPCSCGSQSEECQRCKATGRTT